MHSHNNTVFTKSNIIYVASVFSILITSCFLNVMAQSSATDATTQTEQTRQQTPRIERRKVSASAQKINNRVQETLSNFREKHPESADVLQRAKGVLVMPAIYQAGFGIGGKYGEGALLVDGKVVDYYNLVGASYGFQMGAQKKSLVLAFMDDSALQDFRANSKYELGVNASAAVIKIGADGRLNITDMNKPILAFVIDQRGLMYDLSLAGSKFTRINK